MKAPSPFDARPQIAYRLCAVFCAVAYGCPYSESPSIWRGSSDVVSGSWAGSFFVKASSLLVLRHICKKRPPPFDGRPRAASWLCGVFCLVARGCEFAAAPPFRGGSADVLAGSWTGSSSGVMLETSPFFDAGPGMFL